MTREAVGIIGAGFVGQAMKRLFQEHRVYDPAQGHEDKDAVNRCRVTFVCVPTPQAENGACETSIVREAIEWCQSEILVVRSTVRPGWTDRMRLVTGKRVVFQPEYIGETADHPLADHKAHGFSVLGGPIEDTAAVADLYKRVFNAEHRYYFCSATCAELAKYMENSFYAAKVTFCNEWFDIARVWGVEYNELREIWLADPRISRDHTDVYPQARGFDGKCLPKDLAAIIHSAYLKGIPVPMLRAVEDINRARIGTQCTQGDQKGTSHG